MGDQEEVKQTPASTSAAAGPFKESDVKPELSTKEAYFQQLRAWVNQANLSQNAMASFPYYLMANYPQLFQNSTVAGFHNANSDPIANTAARHFPPRNMARDLNGQAPFLNFNNTLLNQEAVIHQFGGYEFVLAPIWKRVLAEIVDVILLLLLKLMITFTILDLYDLDLGDYFDLDALRKSLEDDYTEVLAFSSDLILIEILTKVAVCFSEALWTMSGHTFVGGATPGKVLLGLRIVHVTGVVSLQPPLPPGAQLVRPMRVLLYPAANPGFRRAFIRAIAKNILMTLLFPICFMLMFFKHNRTAYDIMSKTIVVEENIAPVFRRL